MENETICNEILHKVPHKSPFRFIDAITYLDEYRIEGNFYLDENQAFYKGHFPNFAVTPGVILTEIMAQIGMVAFGIYLMTKEGETAFEKMHTLLTDTNIKFRKQVLPNTRVYVKATKEIFKHGRLKCILQMNDHNNELICSGNMGGMLVIK
jgi:3-hydroxyacyl-[acyl-carrier-protein] dehydratase